MPGCSVPKCQNGTAARKPNPDGVKFYSFPKNRDFALKWWHAIKRADSSLDEQADPRVCSAHFKPSDFLDLKNMGSRKRNIHPDAIPSMLISPTPSTKKPVHPASSAKAKVQSATHCGGCEQLCKEKQGLEEEIKVLQKKTTLLEEELHSARKRLHTFEQNEKMPHAAAKAGLFTQQQAEHLITGTRPRPWDQDALHEGLRHRVHLSRQQYDWLRGNGYPLPALPTLQRYLAGFVLRPGDSTIQLELLAKMTAGMSPMERQCVLMYDEMDLMRVATYDQQLDQVLGPHRHLQQYLVAGIFAKWALPVMFEFDTAASADTIFHLIRGVEAAGANVMSTVSDMGGANQGIWRDLSVSYDTRTWFVNPADPERRVWVFADPPHVLKRLRNNLLDSGIRTSGGGLLDKTLMEEMVAINGAASEYRVAHRVHLDTHVHVKRTARQKVRPAMELVSGSVALAIERHLCRPEEVRALRVFDSGVDVLNAIHLRDSKTLRRGYRGTPEQEAALTALETEAKAMRVGHRKDALLPFQKGAVMNVTSARGLLQDARARFGEDTFLLTRRLTQDRLEGFFGMVRGKGGANANPTPSEVRSRLRLLTLLFAIQRGVRPLDRDGSSVPASEAAVREEEVDPACEAQLEALEQERLLALDGEVAADLQEVVPSQHQPATEDPTTCDPEPGHGEEGLAELEELLDSVPAPAAGVAAPAPGPAAGARDLETGVPAGDSAMAYVAGYVSRKRPADSDAGAAAAETDEPLEGLWTRLKSEGGLTVPTASFLAVFRQMDSAFCVQHTLEPDGLSRRPGVIKDFEAVLEAKFGAVTSPRVRRTFARVRTFLRLQRVNRRYRSRGQSDAYRDSRKRQQHVV